MASIENEIVVPFYDESYRSPIEFLPQVLVYYSGFALCAYFMRVRSPFVHLSDASYKENYRRLRIRNLSICLLHSFISGLLTSYAILTAPAMFTGFAMMTYSTPLLRAIPTLSVGYFLHDTIDMVANEQMSKAVIELVLHHFICAFVFMTAICVDKLLPYALIAILMELNSIFLHWRSLNNLTNQQPKAPLYRIVKILNIATIILFRFGVQFYMIYWLFNYVDYLVWQFAAICISGNLTFLVLNSNILYRILRSDGYLRGISKEESFDRGVMANGSQLSDNSRTTLIVKNS